MEYCLHYDEEGKIIRTFIEGQDKNIEKPFIKVTEEEFNQYRDAMAMFRIEKKKLVRIEEEPASDEQSIEELRSAQYSMETDPILLQISGYRYEAEALVREGKKKEAAECNARADALLDEYLAKKRAIREQFKPEE